MSLRFLSLLAMIVAWPTVAMSQQSQAPAAAKSVVQALQQANWRSESDGFSILRALTQEGLLITAYRISPRRFSFEIVVQETARGSRARAVGESSGAVLVSNGGFFAVRDEGVLYPIGYLRIEDEVLSKGWPNAGGLIVFTDEGLTLRPSHKGIPQDGNDILQSRPMLIEPGGKWAMGSNLNEDKLRTILCRRENGEILLVVISRVGMSLFEAGWIMRKSEEGGFFGCDAAVALDGGRSTQVWYSGNQAFSHAGLVPVQNFIVVRQRED